jgi:eukaryotic-like serine/threonine-protein kinase
VPLVKVLDFGISKVTGEGVDNLTKTNAAMGSALYMSPEQMQASRAVDHRTDIYALGASLHELIAGRPPFDAETLPELCAAVFTGAPTPLAEVRSDLPEGLAPVVERAYARDRAHRYPSVADFVMALAAYAPPRTTATVEQVARIGGLPIPSPANVPAQTVGKGGASRAPSPAPQQTGPTGLGSVRPVSPPSRPRSRPPRRSQPGRGLAGTCSSPG